MLSQSRLLDLIGRIYDAAADEHLWPVFLEDFAEAVDGTMTGLIFHKLTPPVAHFGISVRCDPECKDIQSITELSIL